MFSMAMQPKLIRSDYFESCRRGAEEAAKEVGVKLIWNGPVAADARGQVALIREWMDAGVDALAVSVESAGVVSPALREAKKRGVRILTWDSDAEQDARDFFVNQATAEGIGDVLSAEVARVVCGKGQIVILTASLDSPNQREWMTRIKARIAERYPGISIVSVRPTNEDAVTAKRETEAVMREYPKVGVILAVCAPAVCAAADAIRKAGRSDIKVVGTALPSACRQAIIEGWIESVVLWSTIDLGYLTVQAAAAVAKQQLARGATSFVAGRLGTVVVRDDEIRLGSPRIFSRGNIDSVSI